VSLCSREFSSNSQTLPTIPPQALTLAQQAAFDRQQREQLQLAEQAEAQKLREHKQKALEQRDAQLEQLEQLKHTILAEREQKRIEVR